VHVRRPVRQQPRLHQQHSTGASASNSQAELLKAEVRENNGSR
jgi:hypothetical protein